MRDYLQSFFIDYDYPKEAAHTLLSNYDRIAADKTAIALFCSYLNSYEEQDTLPYHTMLEELKAVSASVGVHEYSISFLMYCLLTKHLREMYEKRGVDLCIWRDSCLDLRHKMLECKQVYHIWGSFVCSWFSRFFDMTRFTLGRLQFESEKFVATDTPYIKCGITVNPGDMVISVHIPSGGRLPHEAVIESYKKAYDFYKDNRIDGKLVIECGSWLLYPRLDEFLTPGSNVLQFMHDFDITKQNETPNFEDCWRLFGVFYQGDANKLPRDTLMRRQYADWIKAGGVPGTGLGVLIFDGEKVIN